MRLSGLLQASSRGRALLQRRWMSTEIPGFAGIAGLRAPGDWAAAAAEAVTECNALVDRLVTSPPSAATVQLLDDISDTVCRVLDAAEFCRNVHADAEWRAAAQDTCVRLGGYIHDLNTHYALYSSLVRALERHDRSVAAAAAAGGAAAGSNSPQQQQQRWRQQPSAGSSAAAAAAAAAAARDGFCEETVHVGRMLQRDFERNGVHLAGDARDRMQALVQETQALGMHITQAVLDPAQYGSLDLDASLAGLVRDLPVGVQRKFRPLASGNTSGRVAGLSVPADAHTLNALLRLSPHEALRRRAYLAYHTQPAANAHLLDRLVEGRHEIARVMGHASYSAWQLDGYSLAGHPGAVNAFLSKLAAAVRPRAEEELAQLSELKARMSRQGAATCEGPAVRPWDRGYLLGLAKAEAAAADLSLLTQHFHLDRVVEGLGRLTRQLMGVTLEEQPMRPGEGWAEGVRRFAATHEDEGFLGTIYLDLYRRPHKFPSPAHFTLRCGRRLGSGSYQTPVVALVAGLAQGQGLSHGEVEMLTHEFGHALHSLLSRTKYQHLSGTRGPLDMVEVPSHALELFASDPRVLRAYLTNPDSAGRQPPPALLEEVAASRRRFSALELQVQLQYCLVDQLLHGPSPPTGAAAAEAVGELVAAHSAFGHVPGTLPHLRFTHFVGYGAIYYSYLYAHCLAAQLWKRHLAADPLGRAAGERLRRQLLEPGGARDPHDLLEGLFAPDGDAVLQEVDGGWHPDPSALLEASWA